jgi:anti-sigma B factor antagonist
MFGAACLTAWAVGHSPDGLFGVRIIVCGSEVTVTERAQAWLSQGDDGAVLVHVRGDIDTVTADALNRVVLDATTQAGRSGVVLDLSGVAFIDSVGLAALIAGYKTARAAGVPFTVGEASPFVTRLLQITGLAPLWQSSAGRGAGRDAVRGGSRRSTVGWAATGTPGYGLPGRGESPLGRGPQRGRRRTGA